MTLARDWTRQLYGAWGVALLAPVTMIGTLAVLALSGGFGGLSALGQLVSGPAVPVDSGLPGGRAQAGTAARPLPVVPASATGGVVTPAPTRVAALPGAARTGGSVGGGSHAGGGGGQRVGSGGGQGATQPVAPPSTPTQPAPPVGGVGGPSPPPATGPVPALVNQVVAVGVAVTSKLPAPLAAIGTSALVSLGQTLNTLLTPHS